MKKKFISVVLFLAIVITLLPIQLLEAAPNSALRDVQTHYWSKVAENELQPEQNEYTVLWMEIGKSYQRQYDGRTYDMTDLKVQLTANLLLYDNGDLFLSTDTNLSEGSYSKVMSNVKAISETEVPLYKTRFVLESKLSNNSYAKYSELEVSEDVETVKLTTILTNNGELFIMGGPKQIPTVNRNLTFEEMGVIPEVLDIPYKEAKDFRTSISVSMMYPFSYQDDPRQAVKIADNIDYIIPSYYFNEKIVHKSLAEPSNEINETSTEKGNRGFFIDKSGNIYYGFPTQTELNVKANENVINYLPIIDTSLLEDGTLYHNNQKVSGEVKDFGQFSYLKNDGTLYNYENKLISEKVKFISDNGGYFIKNDDSLWDVFTNSKVMEDVSYIFYDHPVRENGEVFSIIYGENNSVMTKRLIAGNGIAPAPAPKIHEGKIFKNASAWALIDLREARKSGLTLPVNNLSYNVPITREKFSEVAIKLYESLTGKSVPSINENVFKDTANPEILKAHALGIVKGTSKTTFSPQAKITREEIATMLKRTVDLAGVKLPTATTKTFKDAGQISSWAKEAVSLMSSAKIVKGIDDGTFGPKQNATIEQAIIMANRIIE